MASLNPLTLNSLGSEYFLKMDHYKNGNVAIRLISASDKTPVSMVTVNIPCFILDDGQVLIKKDSENAEILTTLQKIGVITPITQIECGFGRLDLCWVDFDEMEKYIPINIQ